MHCYFRAPRSEDKRGEEEKNKVPNLHLPGTRTEQGSPAAREQEEVGAEGSEQWTATREGERKGRTTQMRVGAQTLAHGWLAKAADLASRGLAGAEVAGPQMKVQFSDST